MLGNNYVMWIHTHHAASTIRTIYVAVNLIYFADMTLQQEFKKSHLALNKSWSLWYINQDPLGGRAGLTIRYIVMLK